MHETDAKQPLNPRQMILDEAKEITSKDRNKSYGAPEDNFQNIADMWNAYRKGKIGEITSFDVAVMMSLMKIARLKFNPTHHDSSVDAIGYLACGADIQQAMQRKEDYNTQAVGQTAQSQGMITGGAWR